MALEIVLEKYDVENKVLLDFDFTTHPNIVAGQTITGTPVITLTSASEITVGTPVVNGTGTIVQAAFSGGTGKKDYAVVCTADTNIAGTKIAIRGVLRVLKT
ncbi:MAG: hypothetical protein EWM72_02762 [Nitrospira sp.]|nr:MAG: hypothetical protein EWM72_02762 [Nitrospira sp.]